MRILAALLLISGLALAAQITSRQRNGAPGSDLDILNSAVATFDGTLRGLDKKRLVLEMSEEQTISVEVNKKTLFFVGKKAATAQDFQVGSVVTVEAKKATNNQLIAVGVRMKESA